MGLFRGKAYLVVSTRELPDILTPQASPIGQISKDGILIDASLLL